MTHASGRRARQRVSTSLLIADNSMALFEARGYEETTLEEVARVSEVSVSTLHRYYTSKDSLLVEHPRLHVGGLAAHFRATDPARALGLALDEAVLAYLAAADSDRPFLRRLRDCIDEVPSASTRIWDHWRHETTALLCAVQERGQAARYVPELVTGQAMTVVITALDHARREQSPAQDIGTELLRALGGGIDSAS